MATQLEIYNLALALIGKPALTSISGTDELTSKCDAIYALTRDALLRDHAWGFATKRDALTVDGTAPASGYPYRYALPAGCLQVQAVNEDDGNTPTSPKTAFTVENGYVLTNTAEAIVLKYTTQVTDPTKFDAAFTMCLAARMAAMLAYVLDGNAELEKALEERAEALLQRAKISNVIEGIPQWADAVYRATMGLLAENQKAGVDEWKIALKFRALYATARDALLREYPWNFAIKREAVSMQGDPLPGGYAYRWELPIDCLRVLAVNPDDGQYPAVEETPFVVENGYVLTNAILTA